MPDAIARLRAIMAALRDPDTGCPWDVKQDFKSIAPYTIEEAYEVAEAIDQGDMDELKNELGDLLFQVVFHARMAEEAGAFTFDDVANAVSDKMERRHPHVFGDTQIDGAADVKANWEAIKAAERAAKAGDAAPSLMDDIPLALPGLSRAVKIQNRAARVDFDWGDVTPVFAKLEEEIGELRAEMAADPVSPQRLTDEMGDILFVAANIARHLKVDPEQAVRGTNEKFAKRFRWMEQNHDLSSLTLEEMEALWQQAKKQTG